MQNTNETHLQPVAKIGHYLKRIDNMIQNAQNGITEALTDSKLNNYTSNKLTSKRCNTYLVRLNLR